MILDANINRIIDLYKLKANTVSNYMSLANAAYHNNQKNGLTPEELDRLNEISNAASLKIEEIGKEIDFWFLNYVNVEKGNLEKLMQAAFKMPEEQAVDRECLIKKIFNKSIEDDKKV